MNRTSSVTPVSSNTRCTDGGPGMKPMLDLAPKGGFAPTYRRRPETARAAGCAAEWSVDRRWPFYDAAPAACSDSSAAWSHVPAILFAVSRSLARIRCATSAVCGSPARWATRASSS
jgi:hypothetical protein